MAAQLGGMGERGVVALRSAAAGLRWFLASVASLVAAGVGAKGTCSSEVGSVVVSGSDALRVRCDLRGWVSAVGVLGGAAVFLVACLGGVWRRWPASIVAAGTMVMVPLLRVVALVSVDLRRAVKRSASRSVADTLREWSMLGSWCGRHGSGLGCRRARWHGRLMCRPPR